MKNMTLNTKYIEEREYCGQEGNVKYTGVHLLIELWTKHFLDDSNRIREIIVKAINTCGATMLGIDLHVFTPNGGISGVAILQESHLSIHTWPEYDYAALDLFVCGTLNPHLAIPVIKDEFKPFKIDVQEIRRGVLT
ncbi:MAG: adenosylmethionine decarboxylase [Deltaproteobacteria bacterium]|nr:adenosylmethionine decarboxylase [Deltaproteobacteria bacterium]